VLFRTPLRGPGKFIYKQIGPFEREAAVRPVQKKDALEMWNAEGRGIGQGSTCPARAVFDLSN